MAEGTFTGNPFRRYGAAGIIGGAVGGYMGGDARSAMIGAGVGMAGYGAFKHRAALGAKFKGLQTKFPTAKHAFKSAGKWAGRGFVALEALSLVQDTMEGEGLGKELANRNWGGVAGQLTNYAFLTMFGVQGLALLPFVAAKEIYSWGEASREHVKKLRQVEMGGQDQVMDAINSAGAATMRQRAASALNNTHLNGRMALGNEGFLMHRSFR